MDELSTYAYEALFRRSPHGIVILADGRGIVDANDCACRFFRISREDMLGRTAFDLGIVSGDDRERLWAGLRERGSVRDMALTLTLRDGERRHTLVSVETVEMNGGGGYVSTFVDVTDLKRAEEALRATEQQLQHAQKMEAIGRVAGGVAHDFNNLLSVVLSYGELIATNPGSSDVLRADIGEIQRAAKRATELTRQLLAFSRHQRLEPRTLNLNTTLAGMEKMLGRLLGADVELIVLPQSALGNVRGDPGQIEQVVMNLAVNARDAMPQGGRLTLETKNVDFDEDHASEHTGIDPGSYVMLSIRDTGVGMDAETRKRIFEPFFTTKERGKGTGLGLSTVFGIVKQSGGHITVWSEPQKGATFNIYFPRSHNQVDAPSAPPPVADAPFGHETVLLVEDDEQVRGLATKILRRSGYLVLAASNAGEALLICERERAKIDLLLTDVVMPLVNGRQLAERLKQVRPEMKVLYMSGYVDDPVLQQAILEADAVLLEKPLTPGTLIRKVRQVLERDVGA